MTKHYFAFPISDDLRDRTRAYIAGIRASNPDLAALRQQLNRITDESVQVSLHYFLLHSMELAGVGLVMRRAAGMAVSTAQRAITVMSHRVIAGLSAAQLAALADFFEETLVEHER